MSRTTVKSSGDTRQETVTRTIRILIGASLIVALLVVVLAASIIHETDVMAATAEQLNQEEYRAVLDVRSIQISLLRTDAAMRVYLSDPSSEEANEIRAQLYEQRSMFANPLETVSLITSEERSKKLAQLVLGLREANDRVLDLANAGSTGTARTLFYKQAVPLYEACDDLFDEIVADGMLRVEEAAAKTAEDNRRINNETIVISIGVLASIFIVYGFSARAIQRSNAEIDRNELLYRVMAEHGDDIFELYSLGDEEVDVVSPNAPRIFGVPPEEYEDNDKALYPYLSQEDRERMAAAYNDRDRTEPADLEFRYTHPVTHEALVFHTVLYPIFDEEGRVTHHLCVTHDVTADRKVQSEIEDALRDAEFANKSKRDFLSRMSHEVRTPINAIIGMEALASGNLDNRDRLRRYLRQINVSARHLLSLVDDILDMSRIESGTLELEYKSFDLLGLVSDVVLLMTAKLDQKEQAIRVDTSLCSVREVVGDELRLQQILVNLLSNASKFTQRDGRIRLTVRQGVPRSGFIRTTFSVQDNGRGIPKSDIDRVFLPFERGETGTGRQDGVGLGLTISKHLIEAMGGAIWVESEENAGSVFTFEVSLGVAREQQPEQAELPTGEPAAVRNSKGLVLIAEDNEINMEVARELLSSSGYEVEEAVNGQQAVEAFERSGNGAYVAVILDIQMPVMDGITAAGRIRQSEVSDGRTIPIIAMTANVFNRESEGADNFDAFLSKPVVPEKVDATIQNAIRHRRAASNNGG